MNSIGQLKLKHGNYGFGFSKFAKNLKGKSKERNPSKGKYRAVERISPMRFWASNIWQYVSREEKLGIVKKDEENK